MKKEKLEVGYIVYHLSVAERKSIRWASTCDRCNKHDLDHSVYIPVLNYNVCPNCFKEWSTTVEYEEEDSDYEQMKSKDFEQIIAQRSQSNDSHSCVIHASVSGDSAKITFTNNYFNNEKILMDLLKTLYPFVSNVKQGADRLDMQLTITEEILNGDKEYSYSFPDRFKKSQALTLCLVLYEHISKGLRTKSKTIVLN